MFFLNRIKKLNSKTFFLKKTFWGFKKCVKRANQVLNGWSACPEIWHVDGQKYGVGHAEPSARLGLSKFLKKSLFLAFSEVLIVLRQYFDRYGFKIIFKFTNKNTFVISLTFYKKKNYRYWAIFWAIGEFLSVIN